MFLSPTPFSRLPRDDDGMLNVVSGSTRYLREGLVASIYPGLTLHQGLFAHELIKNPESSIVS